MFGLRKRSGVILLSLVIFVGSVVAARRAMADEPLLRLYFVPFAIETYIPITTANIEEHGNTIWFLEAHPFIPKLSAALKSRPTKRQILSNGIRLKADLGPSAGVFFVDRNGTVLNEQSGATFVLLPKELERLEKEIRYFIGVVDVKASKRVGGVKQ